MGLEETGLLPPSFEHSTCLRRSSADRASRTSCGRARIPVHTMWIGATHMIRYPLCSPHTATPANGRSRCPVDIPSNQEIGPFHGRSDCRDSRNDRQARQSSLPNCDARPAFAPPRGYQSARRFSTNFPPRLRSILQAVTLLHSASGFPVSCWIG